MNHYFLIRYNSIIKKNEFINLNACNKSSLARSVLSEKRPRKGNSKGDNQSKSDFQTMENAIANHSITFPKNSWEFRNNNEKGICR